MPSKFPTDLKKYARRRDTTGPYADSLDIDVIIVGSGFAGCYALYEMRKLGLKAVIYEAGTGLGGTWRWNCYPGARVDSEVPDYEFSIPEVWKDWSWSTNYPDYEEIRAYFDHVDKVLNISKDTAFETVVVDAQFHTDNGKWHVKTEDGRLAKAKYFIAAVGPTSKRHIPDFPGLEKFQGILHHSSFWPDEGVDVKGKRVAVIGIGASGVQLVQAIGPEAASLTVIQRTPNLCLPMTRKPLTVEELNTRKMFYPHLFRLREKDTGGYHYGRSERYTFDDSPEEREEYFQTLWDQGGFHFWVSGYKDLLTDMKANQEAYNFWAKTVRKEIIDPVKRDVLAPLVAPHAFGVKRPGLQQTYWDQFNRPNVNVVDAKKNPIAAFSSTGILFEDGTHHEFDIIAVATGFDVNAGSMVAMGLKSIHRTSLGEDWKEGLKTYLGLAVPGYPNMFYMYGPHAPTLLSNGPTCVEIQGRFIRDVIRKCEREGVKYIQATDEASSEWVKKVESFAQYSLFPTVKSTYMGGNIPGKKFEAQYFIGGCDKYAEEIRSKIPGYQGFDVVRK